MPRSLGIKCNTNITFKCINKLGFCSLYNSVLFHALIFILLGSNLVVAYWLIAYSLMRFAGWGGTG